MSLRLSSRPAEPRLTISQNPRRTSEYQRNDKDGKTSLGIKSWTSFSLKSSQDAKRQKGPELEFQMTTHDNDVNMGMRM